MVHIYMIYIIILNHINMYETELIKLEINIIKNLPIADYIIQNIMNNSNQNLNLDIYIEYIWFKVGNVMFIINI